MLTFCLTAYRKLFQKCNLKSTYNTGKHLFFYIKSMKNKTLPKQVILRMFYYKHKVISAECVLRALWDSISFYTFSALNFPEVGSCIE